MKMTPTIRPPLNMFPKSVETGLSAESNSNEEELHFESVYTAYRQYATFCRFARRGMQQRFCSLPRVQRQYLPAALQQSQTPEANLREQMFKEAEIRNQFLLDTILRYSGVPTSQDVLPGKNTSPLHKQVWTTEESISKVGSVLKSLARDWSLEGKAERDTAFIPILKALQTHVPIPQRLDHGQSYHDYYLPIKVCVPGAGVGRLALEIRSLGYEVQGNEFSAFMLLASNFILNSGANPSMPFRISPFLMETRNVFSVLNTVREVKIPDCDVMQMMMHPKQQNISSTPDFSMVAGDFVTIYSDERQYETWNCCVSCFFLDTAPSIIEYFLVIYNMLVSGGIFINFGPLLFHWSGPNFTPTHGNMEEYDRTYAYLDKRYLTSVDMSWEDARASLINIGFDILEEKAGIPSKYTSDETSMMITEFRCVFFVAKKRPITITS